MGGMVMDRRGKTLRRAALLGAVAVSAVLFAGQALADVKIGVLMPLSGKGASYGQHQDVALKMALETLAKTGGKGEKIETVVYDTRGENAEAINLTRKLIFNDKVLAIVGPFFSAECEVAFPIAAQGKTPIVTASSAKPGIATKNRPWAFRNALSSDQMNGYLLDVWLKRNPIKRKMQLARRRHVVIGESNFLLTFLRKGMKFRVILECQVPVVGSRGDGTCPMIAEQPNTPETFPFFRAGRIHG